jgi:hypothetical protein
VTDPSSRSASLSEEREESFSGFDIDRIGGQRGLALSILEPSLYKCPDCRTREILAVKFFVETGKVLPNLLRITPSLRNGL